MLRRYARQAGTVLSVLGSCVLASGCSDDDNNVGPDGPLVVEMADQESGNDQTGEVGEQLEEQLRVFVTRGGEPAGDVEVVWESASGGNLSPNIARTDDTGLAVARWTLGPATGGQTATAEVDGADGSPVTFSATANPPSAPPPPPPGGPPVAVQGSGY